MTAEDVPEANRRRSAAMLRGFRYLFGSEPDEDGRGNSRGNKRSEDEASDDGTTCP